MGKKQVIQENGAVKCEEGIDFYYDENGLFVFTEAYHLKRGYCCGNGCKHCPYPPEPSD